MLPVGPDAGRTRSTYPGAAADGCSGWRPGRVRTGSSGGVRGWRAARTVAPDSTGSALRLAGARSSEPAAASCPSEGLVLGAVQVPPDGQPLVFLADHPTTGGYPVVGVVEVDDLWQCAQLRPGEPVGFRHIAG